MYALEHDRALALSDHPIFLCFPQAKVSHQELRYFFAIGKQQTSLTGHSRPSMGQVPNKNERREEQDCTATSSDLVEGRSTLGLHAMQIAGNWSSNVRALGFWTGVIVGQTDRLWEVATRLGILADQHR